MSKRRAWLTAFVPHRLELYLSPSWSMAPRPLRVILERLEIEHLRHGGFKNGALFVSYGEFVKHGVSRKSIKRTLQLGSDLGLVEVIPPEGGGGNIREPNAYRLTYVPGTGKERPTDEWKSMTEARVKALLADHRVEEKAAAIATRKAA